MEDVSQAKKIVHQSETNGSSMASLVEGMGLPLRGVSHVSIRIRLTTNNPRHNVRTTEGRFAASMLSDAGLDAEVRTCQGTSGCFFYDS